MVKFVHLRKRYIRMCGLRLPKYKTTKLRSAESNLYF